MKYIVTTSKFNPLSFEDYLKPFAPAMASQTSARTSLQKDLSDAMALERIVNSLDPNEEGNQDIIDNYNSYIQGLKDISDNLYKTGSYSPKDVVDLHNKYKNEISNIATVDGQLRAMYTKINEDLRKDPSLIHSNYMQEPTFAQMYANPYLDQYKTISGDQIYNQTYKVAQGLAEEQASPTIKDKDGHTIIGYNAKMTQQDIDNQIALIDWVMENHDTNFNNAVKLGLNTGLYQLVLNQLGESGVLDWNNDRATSKTLGRIYDALYAAVGKSNYTVNTKSSGDNSGDNSGEDSSDGRLNSNFQVMPWTGSIGEIKEEATIMNNIYNNLDGEGNITVDGETIDVKNLLDEYPKLIKVVEDHPLFNDLTEVLTQLRQGQNPSLAKIFAKGDEMAIQYYKQALTDYAWNTDPKDWNLQDILKQNPGLMEAIYKSWKIDDPNAVSKAKLYSEQIRKLNDKGIDIFALPKEVQQKLISRGAVDTYTSNPNYHSYTNNVWVPMFNKQGDSMYKNAINWLQKQSENSVIWKTEDGVNTTSKGGTTYTMKDILDRLNEDNVIDISYNPLTDYYGDYMQQQGITDDVLILTVKTSNGKGIERYFIPTTYFGTDMRDMAKIVSDQVQNSSENNMYNHTSEINDILRAYAGQSRNTLKDFQNKDKNKPQ